MLIGRKHHVRDQGFDRISGSPPAIQTALERTHVLYPRFPKLKRHTGASGFVWSSAVKNNLVLTWNFMRTRAEVVRPKNQCAG
jgi:hypothetical protein